MATENIYNMNEIGLFCCAQPNKTLSARKVLWVQNSKGQSHSCSCCNTTHSDKFKPMVIYKFIYSRCFGRWLPTYYARWFANEMAWMTSNILESWMMSLNVHFKSQKWKVILIMENFVTHSLKHVGRGESFGFSTL